MIWPQELWLNPPLLLAVVLLSTFLPLPSAYHPLSLYRYLAFSLARKVNPDPNRPRQQLYISGTLAVVIATLPILALCYSLYQFAELPFLLDGILLYASLNWSQRRTDALQLQQLLQRNQLSLARERSASLLLRRSDNLTAMGLSKALCESLLLRSSIEVVATLLWFLLGGGIAALAYRLLVVLQQQWNRKLADFTYFGLPANALVQWLSSPGLVFCCVVLALNYGIRRCWRNCRAKPVNMSRLPYWLLCCGATALKRSLGGPVYYCERKLQRSRIQQQQQPTAADINKALKLCRQCHQAALTLAGVILLLQWVWWYAR
ncbi:MAG: cobalamin biosynthesis protein [Gammaproteobacteria bacterium]|nr:cobalamin biosynthesis protein [Gammaproteobacteria bacterium]